VKRMDFASLCTSELQRLGVSLVSRVVQVNGEPYTLTDRRLVNLFRNVEGAPPDGCWNWLGARNAYGYGTFAVAYEGLGGKKIQTRTPAHRAVYMVLRGAIPAGLTLDHLCRVRHCVNPGHLDPCTAFENTARSPFTITSINRAKNLCLRGHPFDLFLTRSSGRPERACRTCKLQRLREFRARRKKMAAQP